MAGKRKYDLKEDYFEKVDSEEKAYWLGFIVSDGYIGLKRGKPAFLEVCLKISDLGHLEKLKNHLGYGGPIHITKKNGKTRSRLIVNSKKFVSHLINMGVENNKSLTCVPIYFDDPNLQKSFWRGMFDGDGTIFTIYPKDRDYNLCLGLIGTYEVCEAFGKYVRSVSSTKTKTIEKRIGCYRFLVASKKYAKEIHSHFYNGSQVYLERKKNYVD
jgi:hypothetical protein